ncbi:MAG: hypothetical protein NZM35_11485, partial [Chitinophagales bacterium]|nr:hypothetical protein [Chitinophagales bacterium]
RRQVTSHINSTQPLGPPATGKQPTHNLIPISYQPLTCVLTLQYTLNINSFQNNQDAPRT